MGEQMLDVDDLARKLKQKKSWVYQNHARLRIPSVRIGNSVRFPESKVDEWINGL